MSLSIKTRKNIYELLVLKVREKIKNYNPETDHKPFHYRLLGRDRYTIFSFIQSMNTTFGMSIWEQISEEIAIGANFKVKRQYQLLGTIDSETEALISKMHYDLRKNDTNSSKPDEINSIRDSIKKGEAVKDPDSIVDVYLNRKGINYFLDITSVKPNIKEFVSLKLKLLRWVALSLSQSENEQVESKIIIPYNPYHPEPYERWTLQGMYDLKNNEILVGEDYWNFIADDNIYEELLDVFSEAGEKIRVELDQKFDEFKNLKD